MCTSIPMQFVHLFEMRQEHKLVWCCVVLHVSGSHYGSSLLETLADAACTRKPNVSEMLAQVELRITVLDPVMYF